MGYEIHPHAKSTRASKVPTIPSLNLAPPLENLNASRKFLDSLYSISPHSPLLVRSPALGVDSPIRFLLAYDRNHASNDDPLQL